MARACDICSAKTQRYLCNGCSDELDAMFRGMFVRYLVDHRSGRSVRGPGWLELLNDAARNRTRLGDGGRRRYTAGRLVTYTNERPAADGHGTEGQRILVRDLHNGRMTLTSLLADGRINGRAVELHTRARETIVRWSARMNGNHSMANHPEAKQCYLEMHRLVKDIEHCINRPPPPVKVGPCPTRTGPDSECGWALEARQGAVEVTCRKCQTTYNVEKLRNEHLASIGHRRYTRARLLELLEEIGEPVASSTMHDWIRTGKLKCYGFERPTMPGKLPRIMLTRHSDKDKPVYRLEDARKLRNKD